MLLHTDSYSQSSQSYIPQCFLDTGSQIRYLLKDVLINFRFMGGGKETLQFLEEFLLFLRIFGQLINGRGDGYGSLSKAHTYTDNGRVGVIKNVFYE